MRPFARLLRPVLVSCLSLLLVLPAASGLAAPAWAAHTPHLDTLTNFETLLFGKSRPQLPLETRLRAVETNVFGQYKTGSTSQRLNQIGSALSSRNNSYLMPPIAPALDTGFSPPAAASGFTGNHAPPSEPDKTIGMLREALRLHADGKVRESEIKLRKVLDIDPYNTDALFSLGAIEEARGDYHNARKHYRDALSSSPDDPEISDALSSIERKLREKPPVMADSSGRDFKMNPKDLKALAAGAASDYKKRDYDSAISKLSHLNQYAPADASVQYGLAQAWRGKGDIHRARYHMQQAKNLDPGNATYGSAMTELNQQLARDNTQLAAYPQDTRTTGDIVPFTPDVVPGERKSGLSISGTGLGSIASLLSSLGSSRFTSGAGYGIPASYGRGSASMKTRLKRALGGSLAGAAAGGLAGRGTELGVKRGAMTGALTGGLAGLMMGGF